VAADALWFDAEGAGANEFLSVLRELASEWPESTATTSRNTGAWIRSGFVIAYADRSDPVRNAVVRSFRVDYDGRRAFAAEVSPEHVDQGGFFDVNRPEGDAPIEIADGDARTCAVAAASWFRCRLVL
jgi:hypothetical protein